MPKNVKIPVEDSPEDIAHRVRTNLALIVQLCKAEQLADHGGTELELEQDAWYAIEVILRDARAGVQQLAADIELIEEAGAAKGGAR